MLRIHLPPNLAAAAARNAIPLKLDFDLSAPPGPELLPVLALLQRWSAAPTPPRFLQLTRAQLRDLADAAGSQPVFFENNQPAVFHHAALLSEPTAPPPPSPPRPPSFGNRHSAIGNSSSAAPMTVDGSEHFLAITLPSREHPTYVRALELVKAHGFILEPSNRRWWLRDRHKTLNFLAENLARLRDEFAARFTPNFEQNTARLAAVEISAEISGDRDAPEVTLALRAGSASDDALRSALATNRGYVETDGQIVLLDPVRVTRFVAAQRALAGDPAAALATRQTHRIPAFRAIDAQQTLEALSPSFQPPEAWRVRTESLRHLSRLEPAPLPPSLRAALRPYQQLGAAWLWHLHRHKLAGILADEMGLGKTLQTLALLAALPHRCHTLYDKPLQLPTEGDQASRHIMYDNPGGAASPSLVVCPASLLENWRRESARFAPQLRVFVHHGANRLAASADFDAHDLVITSYGTLTRDQPLFAAREFACVIADEAQHIKNRRTQNAAALRSLRARSRFVLTGTPVENSLDDLRSLFEFLLPGYVEKVPPNSRADERTWFDDRLRAKTAPYILRRTKQAVAPELPEKLEHILWCELTSAQAALYRETQQRTERELFDLEAAGASESRLRLAALTQLLRLRQICCDPRLLPGSQLAILNSQPGFADSAKLAAFRELLDESTDDHHRLLVFSQFTALLALLREDLTHSEIPFCYLDGTLSPAARQAEVDRFQTSPDVPVFLISLKAGGAGLNLTAADTVVHFDPWWNPAVEAQATDRAHRIGQKRVVTSYKLIASGTVEEKVLALQTEKRALLADVFEASDAAAAKLSLADLKSLLA
ncbi:MAG TPA: DEAD/DEAH box helicase [Opitutus sp.]|nr:DEAD/DEAH box helicase [Opitutus sp.]